MSGLRHPSDLLVAQWQFTEDLARLIDFVRDKGWRIKITECGVAQKRKSQEGPTFTDQVHRSNSNHYRNLAADIQIFIPNEEGQLWFWVSTSDHPAWKDIDSFWCSLRDENITGIGFSDANHVSRKWQGVA